NKTPQMTIHTHFSLIWFKLCLTLYAISRPHGSLSIPVRSLYGSDQCQHYRSPSQASQGGLAFLSRRLYRPPLHWFVPNQYRQRGEPSSPVGLPFPESEHAGGYADCCGRRPLPLGCQRCFRLGCA